MEHAISLEGYGVRLEPLAQRHLPGLMACDEPALWEFTYQPSPFGDEAGAREWLASALGGEDRIAFAIVDVRSGEIAGSTRYLDVQPAHRKLEIGWTFLARRFWRTHVNTACKLLLLRYAFERWGARRVQLKAEAINQRSHRAILGIGATFEGTLRAYRVRPDGESRDTSFYSIIRPEWPAVERRLTAALERGALRGARV